MSDDDKLLTAFERITRLIDEREKAVMARGAIENMLFLTKADLSAARAALERLAHITKYSDSAAARYAEDALARLGTGEALAAVQEAIAWLESRPDMTEGDAAVSSRLKAVFGE